MLAWHHTHHSLLQETLLTAMFNAYSQSVGSSHMDLASPSSVLPEGCITPKDSGLYLNSQIKPLQKIIEFAHLQNQKIRIQLAHAGHKASTIAPYYGSVEVFLLLKKLVGGWKMCGVLELCCMMSSTQSLRKLQRSISRRLCRYLRQLKRGLLRLDLM